MKVRASITASAILLVSIVVGRATPSTASPVVVHGAGGQVLPAESFGGPLPGFAQRTVTDRGALEPPIAFGADGALFYPSWVYGDLYPADTTTVLYRSVDGGTTWTDVTPRIAGVRFNDKGGDPFLYHDETTGRLFYVLYYLDCSHIAWTDDGGRTWGRPLQGPVCEPFLATDYPKLWTSRPVGGSTPAGAPFYVHLCYNAVYRLACQRSVDGGLTFAPSPSPDPDSFANYMTKTCWSFHAMWTVTTDDGTIYMPRPYCNDLEVAISRDNGLTWERKVVARYPDAYGTDFGSDTRLAMDSEGNLYYMWIAGSWYVGDGRRPFLSISRNGGEDWSAPIDIGVPGVTAAKFPFLLAGDEGRISFFYVGSTVPGGFEASAEDMAQARWDAYVGFSLNALDEDPVFATTTANPADDPLRRGVCQYRCSPEGTDCVLLDCSFSSSEIGMFDYLQLALDPTTGMVAASLVDLCAGECATGASDDWSFTGAVGVQVEGPSLFAN